MAEYRRKLVTRFRKGREVFVFDGAVAEVLEADPLALDAPVLRHRALGQHAHGVVAAEVEQDVASVEEEKIAGLRLALGGERELGLEDLGGGALGLLDRARRC